MTLIHIGFEKNWVHLIHLERQIQDDGWLSFFFNCKWSPNDITAILHSRNYKGNGYKLSAQLSLNLVPRISLSYSAPWAE